MGCLDWLVKLFKRKQDARIMMDKVGEQERIVRFLLSPLHFKTDGSLRPNAFNPSPNSDEVSVNRLDITPIEETKFIAKTMAAKNSKHTYFGFALHTKQSAILCGVKDVVPDPIEGNNAHAEIKLGVVRESDEIPAEMLEIRDNWVERCKLLKDSNPDQEGWSGEVPVYDRT
jgi:hypothetical protein